MFCLGVFSTVAQVVLMRELLVAFFGNELTIAAILAAWLVCVGTGAALSRRLSDRLSGAAAQGVLLGLSIALFMALPLALIVARSLRSLLGVAFGEFAPLTHVVLGALSVCGPACLAVGFSFPVACRLLALASCDDGSDPRVVSRVYALEALGSMLAGLGVTFLLLPRCSVIAIVATGLAFMALAAGLCVPLYRGWLGRSVVACQLIAVFLCLVWQQPLERAMDRLRWQAFGVLSDAAAGNGVELLHSQDSIYQNLTVTELSGQYTLYGNGEVLLTFPDPHSDEHAMHFIMAQNPDAKRVLVLGSSPPGEIQELLKYPVERVVAVELDPAVASVMRSASPQAMSALGDDSRLTCVAQDGIRYLVTCEAEFDIVIINAPAPTTAAANRFYTVEFFRSVKRVLSERGFVYTSLEVSERLMDDAAILGGSLFRTLGHVFDTVLVTAEAETRFLAGVAGAPLTFDRRTLYDRSRNAGVDTRFFRPEYFLGEDALNADKRARVRQRFRDSGGGLNRAAHPAIYFSSLVVWSRFSGSGAEGVLRRLRSLRLMSVLGVVAWVGGICFVVSMGMRHWCSEAGCVVWGRGLVALLLASTGACGMAMELILIFVYQSVYGHVYGRIGLIVGLFMLGLVLGAPSGRSLARRGYRATAWALGAVEALLLLFACSVTVAMRVVAAAGSAGEGLIGVCVVVVGWAIGAEFPLANGLLRRTGVSVGSAAALADASDHLGAALGALVIGVLLLPVLGIASTGLVLAGVKGTALLCLVGAMSVLTPRHRE